MIANVLTAMRLAAAPLVGRLISNNKPRAAMGVFGAAAGLDVLDGIVARKLHQTTALGSVLDPLADKALMAATLASLARRHIIPASVFHSVLIRDALLVGGYLAIADHARPVVPSRLGKACTFSQVALVTHSLLTRSHVLPPSTFLSHFLNFSVVSLSFSSLLDYSLKTLI